MSFNHDNVEKDSDFADIPYEFSSKGMKCEDAQYIAERQALRASRCDSRNVLESMGYTVHLSALVAAVKDTVDSNQAEYVKYKNAKRKNLKVKVRSIEACTEHMRWAAGFDSGQYVNISMQFTYDDVEPMTEWLRDILPLLDKEFWLEAGQLSMVAGTDSAQQEKHYERTAAKWLAAHLAIKTESDDIDSALFA